MDIFYYNVTNDSIFNYGNISNVYKLLEDNNKNYSNDEFNNEIHKSFYWAITKQGYEFWKKIADEWIEIVENYYEKYGK